MTDKITIFWFRQDLRLSDNPGLFEAAKNSLVMPIYIFDEERDGKIGSASKWWLYNSLKKLNESLGNNLNIYFGNSKEILNKIVKNYNVEKIYWNRCYEKRMINIDKDIAGSLGIESRTFKGSILWEPWEILKEDKTFYKVYTAFYRTACLSKHKLSNPLSKPKELSLFKDYKYSAELNVVSGEKWHQKMERYWSVGEDAAQDRLRVFLDKGLYGYKEGRNYPGRNHTSKLSPHLHFGEISPNQIWYAVQSRRSQDNQNLEDSDCFLKEIVWREFSYYLLYHFPELPRKNFQQKFDGFPWVEKSTLVKAWQKGLTGFPIIDAGMRELWQTGYMHNRIRMIVASFLVKNLLIHWHYGEDWFWDCLVDADLANNSMSWQWVAGSGFDAAPYFRVFNPVIQGKKFDHEGDYIYRFVPELKKLPVEFLFEPRQAPEQVLKDAGVILGTTYPMPIVDLKKSREEALALYKGLSS